MKKTFALSLFFVLGLLCLSSCSKDNFLENPVLVEERSNCDKTIIELEELPEEILAYLEEHYSGSPIKEVAVKNCLDGRVIYEIKLKRGPKLRFDEEGNLLSPGNGNGGNDDDDDDGDEEEDCVTTVIDTSEVPDIILDFIAENYPDGMISNVKLVVCPDSTIYNIKVSPGPRLIFDEEGNLLEEEEDDDGDDDDEDCITTVIDTSEVPDIILDFIAENYPEGMINNVKLIECPDGTFYNIKVSPGPRLIFDEEGNLLEEEEDDDEGDDDDDDEEDCEKEVIDVEELPAAAIQYLEDNYPNSHIANVKKETCADGTITYQVKVSPGPWLYFDEEGNFIP